MSIIPQEAEAGGAFEFVPDPGSPDEVCSDDVRKVFDGDRSRVCHPDFEAGDVQHFRGHFAVHRVTPPEGRRNRLCLLSGCVPDRIRLASTTYPRKLWGVVHENGARAKDHG